MLKSFFFFRKWWSQTETRLLEAGLCLYFQQYLLVTLLSDHLIIHHVLKYGHA